MQQPLQVQNNDALFSWETLPLDLRRLIIRHTRFSELYALSFTNHANLKLVTELLGQLSDIAILRLLPAWDCSQDATPEFRRCSGYQNARRETLQFQKLIRRCGLTNRWRNFNTMEAGLLAIMTIPRESFSDKEGELKKLAYGHWRAENPLDALLPSEYLSSEIQRLGADRIAKIVSKLIRENRIFNGTLRHHINTDSVEITSDNLLAHGYLTILAVIILRATENRTLQEYITQLFCTDWVNLTDLLFEIYQYAQYSDNKHLLEVIAWLIETRPEKIEATLKLLKIENQNPANVYILHRLCYLLVKPGCLDSANVLPKESIDDTLFRGFESSRNTISTDYTIWFWVFFNNSWPQGIDLAYSLIARQNHKIDFKYSWFKNVLSDRGYIPTFGNFSGIDITPHTLPRTNQYGHFDYCDFYQANFKSFYQEDIFPSLTFNCCMMDNVSLSDLYCNKFYFSNMLIRGFNCNQTTLQSCKFSRVYLTESKFERSTFAGCVFDNCSITASVSFKDCEFKPGHMNLLTALNVFRENNPVVFANCQLDARSFLGIHHAENLILINCHIENADQLPKKAQFHDIPLIASLTAQAAFELFKRFCKANQTYMIAHLQFGLLDQMKQTKDLIINYEENRLFQIIFNYQPHVGYRIVNALSGGRAAIPEALEIYNSLHIPIIETDEITASRCFDKSTSRK